MKKSRYKEYKRRAKMQRDKVADGVENMNVKAWGDTQKDLNEEYFGTPSKRTTPNIFFETPSPERLRESGAPRNTGNLARLFTTDFASVSEPSDERLLKLAMKKLKMDESVPFSRKRGPSRYQRQLQKNKLNQLIQEAKERKAQAQANEEVLSEIDKELRKNLEKLKKSARKKSIRGGKKRSVRRKKKLQRSRSRSPRRKSPNRRRSTRSPRRKSPNRRRSARGGKRSRRNRRRRARSPRRKLAGKEFNSIRKYLDNMPMPLKVAFPGYVMYHIATDKEAFF